MSEIKGYAIECWQYCLDCADGEDWLPDADPITDADLSVWPSGCACVGCNALIIWPDDPHFEALMQQIGVM